MNDTSEEGLSPDRFVDAMLGYLDSAAIKGALDVDLFSAIPQTDGTAEAIAARVKASPRGVRILCDYLRHVRVVLEFCQFARSHFVPMQSQKGAKLQRAANQLILGPLRSRLPLWVIHVVD